MPFLVFFFCKAAVLNAMASRCAQADRANVVSNRALRSRSASIRIAKGCPHDTMMLRLAAAACCHAAHVKPYGICWTRNEASESHPALNLGNLLRSATSARRASEGKIPLCLFTNLDESTIMNEAQMKYGNETRLFDLVLQDSLATYIPKTGAEALLLWPTTRLPCDTVARGAFVEFGKGALRDDPLRRRRHLFLCASW